MVITVSGELDIATAPRLREHLEAAAGARTLVVDLHAVSFIDSVALAVLLQAQRRLGEGGRMAVSLPAASYTRLIFEAAGLDRCLSLFETRSDALAHVGG